MKNIISILIFTFWACDASEIQSIEHMEIIEILDSNLLNSTQQNRIISDIEAHFQNNKGIKLLMSQDLKEFEIRQKPFSIDDMILRVCLHAHQQTLKSSIDQIPINCDSIDILFSEMIESDKRVRQEGGDMLAVDNKNRVTLISIIEQCGWVENKTKQIWWLSHHSLREYIPHYYPELKKRVGENGLSAANLAYMEDRMLVNAGYPQIYGTQSINGKLYNIFDPEKVNIRRKDAGILISENQIKTIEMECEFLGINWEDELNRMKSLNNNSIHNK